MTKIDNYSYVYFIYNKRKKDKNKRKKDKKNKIMKSLLNETNPILSLHQKKQKERVYSTDIEIGPIKLAVMTVGFNLQRKFNLHLLSQHIPVEPSCSTLEEVKKIKQNEPKEHTTTIPIQGIRYLDTVRGSFNQFMEQEYKFWMTFDPPMSFIMSEKSYSYPYLDVRENGTMIWKTSRSNEEDEKNYYQPNPISLEKGEINLAHVLLNYLNDCYQSKVKYCHLEHGNRKKKNMVEDWIGLQWDVSYESSPHCIFTITNIKDTNTLYDCIRQSQLMQWSDSIYHDKEQKKIHLYFRKENVSMEPHECFFQRMTQCIRSILHMMKRKNKKVVQKRRDFSNQCSLHLDGYNMKLFSNGKVILTGCRKMEQIPRLLNAFIYVLDSLPSKLSTLKLIDISKKTGPRMDLVRQWFTWCEFVYGFPMGTIMEQCSSQTKHFFDLQFIPSKVMNCIRRLECLRTYYLTDQRIEQELTTLLDHCHTQDHPISWNIILQNEIQQLFYNIVYHCPWGQEVPTTPWILPPFLGSEMKYELSMNNYQINLINSTFKTNVKLDREALLRILHQQYSDKIIHSCNDKERYCGLTLKYRLQDGKIASIHFFGAKKCFPPIGSANIAVPHSWKYVEEVYSFLTTILHRHIDEIRLLPNECYISPPDVIYLNQEEKPFVLINENAINNPQLMLS